MVLAVLIFSEGFDLAITMLVLPARNLQWRPCQVSRKWSKTTIAGYLTESNRKENFVQYVLNQLIWIWDQSNIVCKVTRPSQVFTNSAFTYVSLIFFMELSLSFPKGLHSVFFVKINTYNGTFGGILIAIENFYHVKKNSWKH